MAIENSDTGSAPFWTCRGVYGKGRHEAMIRTGTPDETSLRRPSDQVSAASYGTVLIIAYLLVVETDDVASGLGWELVTGVGVATWVAHLFAEALGNRVGRVRVARSPLSTARNG